MVIAFHRQLRRTGLAVAAVLLGGSLIADGAGAQSQPIRKAETVPMGTYRGPKDTPSVVEQREADRLYALAAARAQAVLPDLKRRFIAGLPRGSTLFLTIILTEGAKRENAYLTVRRWDKDSIITVVSTELASVRKYKMGQVLTITERSIVDWTITDASGKEEGNYLGQLFDSRRP